MNKKLIKLSDTHYIIVDDSEIKLNDWVYSMDGVHQWFGLVLKTEPLPKKITHSTQPLELVNWENGAKGKRPAFDKIKSLTLSEVEEVINGYSVEKMADSLFEKESHHILHPQHQMRECYIKGFNTHKELVKDKLFTELENKLTVAKEYWSKFEGEKQQGINYGIGLALEFLKIQSKTEWDVTFDEQGKIKLV